MADSFTVALKILEIFGFRISHEVAVSHHTSLEFILLLLGLLKEDYTVQFSEHLKCG